MGHTVRDREKLVLRVKKIRGQVDGVQRALEEDGDDCFAVLQTVAACRGALNSLMVEIIDGHVRGHILDPKQKPTAVQTEASEQLLEIVRAFLR
jgi:FrmR/RcnR family transcriptional regulator, repressor of frmRAB operon